MPQKYKVFFNHNKVYLVKRNQSNFFHNTLFINLKASNIKQLSNELLTNNEKKIIVFECDDLEASWKIFKNQFTVRKAAGGLVLNQKNELLLIKRKGLWDLPKGHLEEGEKNKQAALREVTEECGIHGQTIASKTETTYHVYYLNNLTILKPSAWYVMNYMGNEKTESQIKEGITEAVWIPIKDISEYIPNSYPSVASLLEKFIGSDFSFSTATI
ncbi:MAG: NUDIX domain-containing protein [Salinivirgaceae bacterium]